MLEASSGPPGDDAEQMEIGEERLRRGGLRAETRRRGLVGEPEHEQRIAQHQLARSLRPGVWRRRVSSQHGIVWAVPPSWC